MVTTWDEAYEAWDEALDEHGDVIVCGLAFSASRVLRECDPIAYRTYMLDWLDGEGIDSDDLEGDDRG